MKNSKRKLPNHLTDNASSKCFVFRHPNLLERKSVIFSYARGEKYETVRKEAVSYANKMNKALGPVRQTSPEGRMSARNRSGIVGVNPKRNRAPRNGLYYYFWNAKWTGCPHHGGVSWPCLAHTNKGAYVLAALTLELKTIKRDRVIKEFEKVKGTAKHKKILRQRPKISMEDFWPE